tara:strand:+ start:336 stop:608 length:273 start_codon:yes stop_codon:yes gene_type:complete
MSGASDTGICPNCESDKYEINIDWKPFDTQETFCYDCGFCTYTKASIFNLQDLNLERKSQEEWGDKKLKPLSKPKEQTSWAKSDMKYYLT